jgi:hypothetical protein
MTLLNWLTITYHPERQFSEQEIRQEFAGGTEAWQYARNQRDRGLYCVVVSPMQRVFSAEDARLQEQELQRERREGERAAAREFAEQLKGERDEEPYFGGGWVR